MGLGHSKDRVDKATGMTEREKKMVLHSWHTFTKHHQDYGVVVFRAFFKKHPDYIRLFSKFKDKDISTLADDPKFRSHSFTLGMQLNNMIDSLERPDNLHELLVSNAEFHAKIKGVTPKHFEEFGNVLIGVLTDNHAKLMTPPALVAWNKFFHLLNEQIAVAFGAETEPRAESKAESKGTENWERSKLASRSKSTTSHSLRGAPSRSKSKHDHHKRSSVALSREHSKREHGVKATSSKITGASKA